MSFCAEQFKAEWIDNYKFISGESWDDPEPTDAEAEAAFREKFPHLL